ncbi:REC8 meiotic recombination protein b isoform X2 [Esox lucius]|uniref:REC8 meiotic recombination protein b isoform X2 n=1 Tax=Esox lucius TaxID=8010 RepID=UPI0014777CC3|nr:REC8 meiotic recombination protein b isoform X2 [Esox lucius]
MPRPHPPPKPSHKHFCCHALNIPDLLVLLEEAEGAQDPFFGVMGLKNQQPSPYDIPQLMESVTPERSLGTSPGTASDGEGFKSPPDAITLKEESLVFGAPEFEGAELPEATGKEIDMLLEQPDQFHNEEERENDRAGDRSRDIEPGMTSIDQLKVSAVGGDSVGLLDEDSGRFLEVALEVTPDLTDAFGRKCESKRRVEKAPESSCGKLLNIEAPPKRRRRRQLIFADPHVQISQDAMRLQIEDALTESVPMSQVLISLPAHRTTAKLFNNPTSSLLHPDLLSLWTQCASFSAPPHHEERPGQGETEEDGSSALDQLRKEGEMERMKSEVELRRRDHCMREIPEELLETEGAAPSEASAEVLLDVSKEDKSLEQITPVSIGSLIEEAPVPMEAILEEIVDLPDRNEEAREGSTEALLSWVSSILRKFGKVYFQSLLPLEADRTTAAHMLSKLLVLVSTRDLSAHQAEPYSPITIIPGPFSALNTEDFPTNAHTYTLLEDDRLRRRWEAVV